MGTGPQLGTVASWGPASPSAPVSSSYSGFPIRLFSPFVERAPCPARCGSRSYSQWRDRRKSVAARWPIGAERLDLQSHCNRHSSQANAGGANWSGRLPCLNGDTPWSANELGQQRKAKCSLFEPDDRWACSTIGYLFVGQVIEHHDDRAQASTSPTWPQVAQFARISFR